MRRAMAAAVLVLAVSAAARAHFVFIVPPAKDGDKVQVVFSDSVKPDKADYLKKIMHTKFAKVNAKGEAAEAKATKGDDALQITLPGKDVTCIVGTTPYGVFERNKVAMLLTYHSRAALNEDGRRQELPAKLAPLQVVVTDVSKEKATVKVLWQGKPLAGADVAVAGEDAKSAVKTEKDGTATVMLPKEHDGLVGIRAGHLEERAGEHDGKKYDQVRTYATTVFAVR